MRKLVGLLATVGLTAAIVVGYGNRHRWYQLPLVPIAAAVADEIRILVP